MPVPLSLCRCVLSALVATHVTCFSAVARREYVVNAWSTSFYKPRAEVGALGIINQDSVFFKSKWAISALHDGFLSQLVEVDGETSEITSFYLCHHRNSFFYEVVSREHGTVTIFEYGLSTKHRAMVREFQDLVPSRALGCVDQLLLRASQSSLLALSLQTGATSILRHYSTGEDALVIDSLTVGYAADVAARAEIYAVAPRNRTVLRLHLADDGGGLSAKFEELLPGGIGADGPLADASAHEPHSVLWSRGKVLFVDGCSLRELDGGHVRTLLGHPQHCSEAASESLHAVPWASQISRIQAVAAAADATAVGAVLLATGAEVLQVVVQGDSSCGTHSADAECTAQHGCGWAEGETTEQRACFSCSGLESWAQRQNHGDPCDLEGSHTAGTRYSLAGCGCSAPTPAPAPAPPDPAGDDDAARVQTVLAVLIIIAAAFAALLLYRRSRRAAAMRELYGVDTAEFHTFTDPSDYIR